MLLTCKAAAPSDPCPTDLDRILKEGQDPGAQQYLVLGTVPIKGKKPGVLGAHAFIVLGTVPIKSKDPGAQQYLVLGTVPIKGKNWGFGYPCIFCTRYCAHHVKTSPTGSCSIFPQSTWAPCPKRWDFLCIHVTGCLTTCDGIGGIFYISLQSSFLKPVSEGGNCFVMHEVNF